MTWFAETSMERLVTSSEGRLTGIEFNDIAMVLLPAAGGWMGAPVELDDDQILDIFDVLGWDRSLRK